MSEPPPTNLEEPAAPPSQPPRRPRWQIGLRTFVLAIAAIAVWMTDIANRRQNDRIESHIETMLPLSRELVVADPTQIAVVKRQEFWYDDNTWDLHLPPGSYRLCLATRDIDIDPRQTLIPPAFQSIPLSPGKHTLALELTKTDTLWRVSVSADDSPALSAEEPLDWNAAHGYMGGSQISDSRQAPPDKPLVLFHRRFMRTTSNGSSSTPRGPSEGIMLWIEPAP